MIPALYLSFIYFLIFPTTNNAFYPNKTTAKGTELCETNSEVSIAVRTNNLFETCKLEQEFEISFDLYFNKFPKRKYILEIVDVNRKRKKILSVRSHAKRQKLIIKSTINRYTKMTAVTRKVNLENWNNTIKIIQEKVQKLASIYSFEVLF